jgi:periplasmic protein TonB
MCANRKMLRLAFFISIACHLAVLLSWWHLALLSEPATHAASRAPSITAQLVARLGESAWVPPTSQAPFPSARLEAMPSAVLTKPGKDAKHAVSGPFSPSTATDDIAVIEKSSARAGDQALSSNAPSMPNDDLNPDGVRQYRLNLAREARRFKHFPQLARDRGWEGVVVVIVSTVAGVPLPQVSLSQSSGFDVLDQEALALVAQAVNTAILPDSLRKRPFALTLPIHYRLDD